jgi:hypothetical protein
MTRQERKVGVKTLSLLDCKGVVRCGKNVRSVGCLRAIDCVSVSVPFNLSQKYLVEKKAGHSAAALTKPVSQELTWMGSAIYG